MNLLTQILYSKLKMLSVTIITKGYTLTLLSMHVTLINLYLNLE